MRRLVQKVVDINPAISADKRRLQEYFDKKSSDGWEMCGQIGIYYVFKRWEEVPNVVEGGNGYSSYNSYQTFGQPTYRPYQPQTPYFNPNGGTSYGTSYNSYNPSSFGVRVNETKKDIFDDDE